MLVPPFRPDRYTDRVSRFFPHSQVWRALDWPEPPVALPAVTRCPLCQRRQLLVLWDYAQDGVWTCCGRCGHAGGLLELAARALGRPLVETARFLGARGAATAPAVLDNDSYLERHLVRPAQARALAAQFWEQCRAHRPDPYDTATAALLAHCGVPTASLISPHWDVRGGRLARFAPAPEIEAFFSGGARRPAPVLPDRAWGWVVVIPFYDLPGRFSGFLLVGRPEAAPVFRRLPAAHGLEDPDTACPRLADPGLAFLPGAGPADARRDLGPHVYVDPDCLAALRAQLRHLSDHDWPLPLVGAWQDATHRTGKGLRTWPRRSWVVRRRIDVHPSDPGAEAALALATRLRCLVTRERRGPDPRYDPEPPATTLGGLVRAVVPWHQALLDRVKAADPAEIPGLLAQLRWSLPQLRQFLHDRRAPESLQHRLCAAVEAHPAIGYAGGVVLEQEDGWWWRAAGRPARLLCDTPIRIQRQWQGRGRAILEGQIVQGTTVHAWREDLATLRRDPWGWLTRFCLEHRLHPPQGWRHAPADLLDVALRLHPPAVEPIRERIGWDPATRCLVWPRGLVTDDGQLDLDQAVCPPPLPGGCTPPAESLVLGAPVPVPEVLCQDDPLLAALWAAMAQVLSLVFGASASQAWAGPGLARYREELVQALGLATLDVPRKDRWAARFQAATAYADQHGWPLLLTGAAGPLDAVPAERALELLPHGQLWGLTEVAAENLRMVHGIAWLDLPALDGLPAARLRLADGLLGHFLQQRPGPLSAEAAAWRHVPTALEALMAHAGQADGPLHRRALALWHDGRDQAGATRGLLARLDANHRQREGRPLWVRHDGRDFLAAVALETELTRHQSTLLLDLEPLTAHWRQLGLPLELGTHLGRLGWWRPAPAPARPKAACASP